MQVTWTFRSPKLSSLARVVTVAAVVENGLEVPVNCYLAIGPPASKDHAVKKSVCDSFYIGFLLSCVNAKDRHATGEALYRRLLSSAFCASEIRARARDNCSTAAPKGIGRNETVRRSLPAPPVHFLGIICIIDF